jgi:CheY-like chemotaxis protein
VKILVVEDEANIRKLITINLASRGYQVIEAENGEDALTCLHEQTPALMILDVKLPGLSGWEVLDQIAIDTSIVADFPVLVMTASLGDAHINLDPYPSVVEVFLKPFRTEKLISVIHRLLNDELKTT